jgi:hypothetical protein
MGLSWDMVINRALALIHTLFLSRGNYPPREARNPKPWAHLKIVDSHFITKVSAHTMRKASD